MTETHRQNLLIACAFAKVLIEAADREIQGGSPSWREEAALELQAALRNLTTPPPDVSAELHLAHEPFEWGNNCPNAPDRGPHECVGKVGQHGPEHVCCRCGVHNQCCWCNEGYFPPCPSSVSDKWVHTDTLVGRVLCFDPPVDSDPPVYNPDINRPSTQPYPDAPLTVNGMDEILSQATPDADIGRTYVLPQHIDSDRLRGPSDWDRECQESRRLNR